MYHIHNTPTSNLLLTPNTNTNMSSGFSTFQSSSPIENPKLGPSLVEKLNLNSANLTKKIIISILKKKQISSTRYRYSRYPSKIASFKYEPNRKGVVSILPSFAKLKESPKVDIRKLVDSVKHIIEAIKKERLFVKNINYEHINKPQEYRTIAQKKS